ncbi:MAG: DUF2249 domain-containing protein [Bacteroidia bacterium]
MNINGKTKISTILRKSPESLYVIVQLSPKFSKLRNPVLRKVMAPRVNIEQAAKIGGCTAQNFFDALRPLGFMVDDNIIIPGEMTSSADKPAWLLHAETEKIKLLDVRPILEGKQDPLNHILGSLKMLQKDDILCVLNSFEPTPLMLLLGKKGYIYHVEKMHDDEVFTYFKKQTDTVFEEIKPGKSNETDFDVLLKEFAGNLQEIDVREMEMPLPMLTILESTAALPQNTALYVNHKKVPVYLLPELEERGFGYAIKELAEGDVKLLIYRK